jgi:16S rRNA (uracil1498-N3)-methyltransferase
VSGFRPRFFVPPGSIAGQVVTLDADDSYHALRVLRLRPGDECEVATGAAVYAATLLPATAGGGTKSVQLSLGAQLEGPEAGAVYRHRVALVQALTRPSALDWSVEKSTEAGASLILLVQTAGSPSHSGKDGGARPARLARIAREAAKQSKQPAIPLLENEPSPAAALERLQALGLTSILLDPSAEQTLHGLVTLWAAEGGGIALWVGPESGWTEAEREGLLRAGVVPARLGRGVLRTETAGPVAVVVARLALGDW